jgi:hypothetical protein
MAGALDTEAPFQHRHARQYAAVRQGGHYAFPSRGAVEKPKVPSGRPRADTSIA